MNSVDRHNIAGKCTSYQDNKIIHAIKINFYIIHSLVN